MFGAGLLVGTALAVIIPEGVRSLTFEAHSEELPKENATHSHEHNDPFSVIGVSLVLGFVFMLLVDQVRLEPKTKLVTMQITTPQLQVSQSKTENMTATIGLVVHAAADGVALGAAATTSHADVEIIVFLAIMLHKAPAAFGLVTFLLHEKIDRYYC